MRTIDPHPTVRGFASVELLAGVAVLLLPTVLLVVSLPVWSERQFGATVAAQEAVRIVVRDYPIDQIRAAETFGEITARHYGIEAHQIEVVVTADFRRGGIVVARVTVDMPAVQLPGVGAIGRWSWTATATRRIDDYHSA